MKPILPLLLVASAALAATRGIIWEVAGAQPATFTRVADAPWLSAGEAPEDQGSEEVGECPWAGADDEADVPFEQPALADADDVDPHAGLPFGHPALDDSEYADLPFGHHALDDSDDADPHAGVQVAAAGVAAPVAPIRRSDAGNGVSIAELYAQRTKLSEHVVRVRGVVVKRTDGILDQTYLHLRDGSGTAQLGDQDLTVTTTQEFELGEEVEVEGRVLVDRDLGLGYQYRVLLEASVRVGHRS